MWPFTQGEIEGRCDRFPDRLVAGEAADVTPPAVSRREYLERICAGGYPEPLGLPARLRTRWFASYVDTITQALRGAAPVKLVTLEDIRRDPSDAIDHDELDFPVVNQLNQFGRRHAQPAGCLTEPQDLDRPLIAHSGHLQAIEV